MSKYRAEPPDIVEKVKTLEDRIKKLEGNPRIGNTSIDNGSLNVTNGQIVIRDTNGVNQVILGLLPDSTYGLAVRDPGLTTYRNVPYVYTAQGPVAGESCTSITYTDLATPGPSVTVPVSSSGRILIIASAQIQWVSAVGANASDDGRVDVEFTGANSRTIDEVNDPLVLVNTLVAQVSTGTITHASAKAITAQALFSGLNPGNTTIKMKYRNAYGPTNSSEFFRRVLTVINL